MIRFKTLAEIKDIEECVVAVGNFDGIHLGHQEIIKRAVADAKSLDKKAGVFTFSNHPRDLLKQEKVKKILYNDDKERIIEELGIDYIFNIPFDENIMNMSPEDFIDKLLIEKMKMVEIVCGFNYHYGYKAAGDINHLTKMSVTRSFGLHIIEPYKVEGQLVSSSRIREAVAEGDMVLCRKLLGRAYSVGGEVVVGNKLGKKIGFPTSNLNIDEDMVSPPNGVYITSCCYNGTAYPSITNVGVKPTIGSYEKNVETHIFNFEKELYGKHIRVDFLEKMRDEKKFDSVEELSKEITANCIQARAYHRRHSDFEAGI